jgi:hypothetical protein
MQKKTDSCTAAICACEAVLILGNCLHRFALHPARRRANVTQGMSQTPYLPDPWMRSAIETFAYGE